MPTGIYSFTASQGVTQQTYLALIVLHLGLSNSVPSHSALHSLRRTSEPTALQAQGQVQSSPVQRALCKSPCPQVCGDQGQKWRTLLQGRTWWNSGRPSIYPPSQTLPLCSQGVDGGGTRLQILGVEELPSLFLHHPKCELIMLHDWPVV